MSELRPGISTTPSSSSITTTTKPSPPLPPSPPTKNIDYILMSDPVTQHILHMSSITVETFVLIEKHMAYTSTMWVSDGLLWIAPDEQHSCNTWQASLRCLRCSCGVSFYHYECLVVRVPGICLRIGHFFSRPHNLPPQHVTLSHRPYSDAGIWTWRTAAMAPNAQETL